MSKKILFFDLDGVLADFDKKVKDLEPNIDSYYGKERERIIRRLNSKPSFYLDMVPIKGAIESWHTLSKKYNNYILSAPKWSSPSSYLEKRIWVENHLGKSVYKKLILSHNKGILTGFALIDDRLKYGVDKFKGLHIHFGTTEFPNWEVVTNYLMEL